MKKRSGKLLFILFALTLLVGVAFDFYTSGLGIKDRFYGTAITSHIFYDGNFVGMFTAIAFIVMNLLLVAVYGFFSSEKKKKVKFFPALYTVIVFCYVFYLFIQGVTFMIEVLRIT